MTWGRRHGNNFLPDKDYRTRDPQGGLRERRGEERGGGGRSEVGGGEGELEIATEFSEGRRFMEQYWVWTVLSPLTLKFDRATRLILKVDMRL